MKRLLLFITFVLLSLAGFSQGGGLSPAVDSWEEIRDETARGANTAARVGNAGLNIISGVRDTLSLFAEVGVSYDKDESDQMVSDSISEIRLIVDKYIKVERGTVFYQPVDDRLVDAVGGQLNSLDVGDIFIIDTVLLDGGADTIQYVYELVSYFGGTLATVNILSEVKDAVRIEVLEGANAGYYYASSKDANGFISTININETGAIGDTISVALINGSVTNQKMLENTVGINYIFDDIGNQAYWASQFGQRIYYPGGGSVYGVQVNSSGVGLSSQSANNFSFELTDSYTRLRDGVSERFYFAPSGSTRLSGFAGSPFLNSISGVQEIDDQNGNTAIRIDSNPFMFNERSIQYARGTSALYFSDLGFAMNTPTGGNILVVDSIGRLQLNGFSGDTIYNIIETDEDGVVFRGYGGVEQIRIAQNISILDSISTSDPINSTHTANIDSEVPNLGLVKQLISDSIAANMSICAIIDYAKVEFNNSSVSTKTWSATSTPTRQNLYEISSYNITVDGDTITIGSSMTYDISIDIQFTSSTSNDRTHEVIVQKTDGTVLLRKGATTPGGGSGRSWTVAGSKHGLTLSAGDVIEVLVSASSSASFTIPENDLGYCIDLTIHESTCNR